MNLAPIILFAYNRPWHTLQTLEALKNNVLAKDSVLYIYADGPKENANDDTLAKIEETRQVLKKEQWCKEVHIILSDTNKGLAGSIVGGVTDVMNTYGKAIILEDDIVSSPYFLQYMNDALEIYKDEPKVMNISGYIPTTTGQEKLPTTFLLRFMSCWGWATWKDRWDYFISDINYLHQTVYSLPDFKELIFQGPYQPRLIEQLEANYTGNLNTWAIKWYLSIFLQKGLSLYPNKSLVRNIGFDGSGENCGISAHNNIALVDNIDIKKIDVIEESKLGDAYLRRFYKYGNSISPKSWIAANYPRFYHLLHRIYKYVKG